MLLGTNRLFSEEQILEQMRKIFLSPSFSVSRILRRFLSYIVHESLAGRSNTIKEYTIAVNVLNKPLHFKPQQDAIVRIHAGRLRRALSEYYRSAANLAMTGRIEITIPKGSYVPEFSDGLNEHLMPEIHNAGNHTCHSTNKIVLAILPFQCFEKDLGRLAFANSLGEQLSAEFGKFNDFSVVSYYSLQQLEQKDKWIDILTAHYGTHYVLTGNVIFIGRKMRVSVQLTEAGSGTQIWTDLFHFPYSVSTYFRHADKFVAGITAMLGDFNGIIIQQLTKSGLKNNGIEGRFAVLSCYYDFYSRSQ